MEEESAQRDNAERLLNDIGATIDRFQAFLAQNHVVEQMVVKTEQELLANEKYRSRTEQLQKQQTTIRHTEYENEILRQRIAANRKEIEALELENAELMKRISEHQCH